ncbi:sulfatase-like hydrolase/transferase [Vibrio sp. WXL103]|uniref:sulfatase-like hydrolase/transferase n=1 Tax=Vibrio sp. WXL103 TaxID=3450710 RepID=UPI003EC4ED3B
MNRIAKTAIASMCSLLAWSAVTADEIATSPKPNVILIYADDISARELPIYGSSQWSGFRGESVSDPSKLATTPVLDRIASEGAFIETAWAATVCSPSRAMMMTGRYASIHKWWHNKDYGFVLPKGSQQIVTPKPGWITYAGPLKGRTVNLLETSELQIGHLAKKAGYATIWAGKTQMPKWDQYGFDEGVFTPGTRYETWNNRSPYTSFDLIPKQVDGKRALINKDTGEPIESRSYAQQSRLWQPSVTLMNHPSNSETFEFWPNTEESKADYGLTTYGPDVELDFIFEFMERKTAENEPFFVYHTSHLGHDAFDWLNPSSQEKWPGTPVVHWDGEKYTRVESKITGENGSYETYGTVTDPGMASHITYLDYQVWLYLEKLKQLEIENDTILIFSADNGTSGYGKHSHSKQLGMHVPLVIYAPGVEMSKQGKQPVIASIADVLPTLADIMQEPIPADYVVHGESLWPFLTTDKIKHRDWIYSYKNHRQMIRGDKVMKDGDDKWWDVSSSPTDLISFNEIKDWSKVSEQHRQERDKLLLVLPHFDTYQQEHDFISLE